MSSTKRAMPNPVLLIFDGVLLVYPDGTDGIMDEPFVCHCGLVHPRVECHELPPDLRLPSEDGYPSTHVMWCPLERHRTSKNATVLSLADA
jgi:hypothetical protein